MPFPSHLGSQSTLGFERFEAVLSTRLTFAAAEGIRQLEGFRFPLHRCRLASLPLPQLLGLWLLRPLATSSAHENYEHDNSKEHDSLK